jgi:hypothetical protein
MISMAGTAQLKMSAANHEALCAMRSVAGEGLLARPPHPRPRQTPPPPRLREDASRLQAMVLGLGNPELPADIAGEQEPLGTDDRVEAAARVWVMTMDVAGKPLVGHRWYGLSWIRSWRGPPR